MNLIVDQGNTATKIVLYNEKDFIVERASFARGEGKLASAWMNDLFGEDISVIISSVTNEVLDVGNRKVLKLTAETPIPIDNNYETPSTLGKDRLANAVAIWAKNKKGNSLCIDLGTCIKYDLVSAEGAYLGGNISPGLSMRYKSLNDYTDKLPILEPSPLLKFHFGKTTETSLLNGVQQGIFHEINGFITRYREEFNGLTIFMTGGDAKYFDKGFKNTIFADADLTSGGLNEILKYNAKA